ncbi:MAG: biotin--[Eubacterium sp.]|nr:biotin--[acetyl-CoA-carboxylase] ligase [Eubacterium sp.]
MTTKEKVLKKLISAQNEFVSGEELADSLGLSRASVWKAIKTLQSEGFTIDAVTNKGYRLNSDHDILTTQTISNALNNSDIEVYHYKTIDSTNNEAKRLLATGTRKILLITADEQTEGRGRQGKSFYSPANTGIYMSLVLHPMIKLENSVISTTAAAVAVCRAIELLTDKKPLIKWVNDVYLDDKKICGILTEALTDFETQIVTSLVLGIGINMNTESFPSDVENASSLEADISRNELIAAIINEIFKIMDAHSKDFIEYYREHSLIIGKRINFIKNGVVTPAKALNIDENGALVVQLDNGDITTLSSGEITIRKTEGE